MKWRWIWLTVTLLLVLFSAHQSDTVRRLRAEARLYSVKVENAFLYTARHMDLTSLPQALAALETEPSRETADRAMEAAIQYSDMLLQLNDLRESSPPSLSHGLSTERYNYRPSTEAQHELQMQILQARLWPPLYTIGFLLEQGDWQLRAEDRQFLSEVTVMVRQLNERLSAVQEALNHPVVPPHFTEWVTREMGEIGPELAAISERIKAHRETIPQ